MAAATTAVLGTAACGSNIIPQETKVDLSDLGARVGQEVVVTAQVTALVNPRAFTIAPTESGAYAEPLLVVHESRDPVIETLPITVTGVVRIFDATARVLGPPKTSRLTQYDGQPYIEATRLEVPPTA